MPDRRQYILEMEGINKSFPGVQALKNVSISVRQNCIHGLVGENGAGKSTLIKILSGVYHSDTGSIKINGMNVHFSNPRESLNSGISTI